MKLNVDQLHITESLTRLGGVETLVKQIISGSPGNHAAALLDHPQTGIAKGYGLRPGKHVGGYLIRRQAASLISHARHLVFHNFSGLMMLSGTIPHERKALFLHTNSEDVFELLPKRLPYLDTIIVGGQDLKAELHHRFPNILVPIVAIELPLDDRYFVETQARPSTPIVLGYSGRLEHEQKQVMRLVELCGELRALGVPFTLEIAGSGSAMETLKSQLPGENCKFLGVLDAAGLHAAYQRWSFLICTSDYETGPLVAMEAMAAGVIPILPDIPCQATALIADLDLERYPRGDMKAAATIVQKLSLAPDQSPLVAALRNQVSDRRLNTFIEKIDSILEQAALAPALGATPSKPFGYNELLPFALRRTDNFYLR